MKSIFLVFLSLVAVGIGWVLATIAWSMTYVLDPLWHASFAVFTWVVGFAIGTRLFWVAVKRMQEVPAA